jgi:RNA polymerase sigma factor (TIGR02999 family)
MKGNDHNNNITLLLEACNESDEKAYNQLFCLVYGQLKKVAHNIKFNRSEFDTLNTTALVHEAYLKLAGNESLQWENRSHFYSVASKAIRHILTDYARKKLAKKRDSKPDEIQNQFNINLSFETAEDIEALEMALEKLETHNKTVLKIVECRFFGGMSIEETARALNTSPSSVKRSWAMGKLWLHQKIKKMQTPRMVEYSA